MAHEGWAAFAHIKGLLAKSSQLVYKGYRRCPMQLQNGIEKLVIFVSQILSDQATRWVIMELELYIFE